MNYLDNPGKKLNVLENNINYIQYKKNSLYEVFYFFFIYNHPRKTIIIIIKKKKFEFIINIFFYKISYQKN